nr:MAG TPA: hypothetical protein [Caudoviricetes sp.]
MWSLWKQQSRYRSAYGGDFRQAGRQYAASGRSYGGDFRQAYGAFAAS